MIYFFIAVFICFLFFPSRALAVPPPDFIFSIGAQIAQVFWAVLFFISAIFGAFFHFFKTKIGSLTRGKRWLVAVGAILLLVIGADLGYYYFFYLPRKEYADWQKESQEYQKAYQAPEGSETKGDSNFSTEVKLDKLVIGDQAKDKVLPVQAGEKFISKIADSKDASAQFIEDYYRNIALGNLEKAYEMSKKGVNLATFKSWYVSTTGIALDNLTRIDEKKSSLELTLFEGEKFTRYGVLMTLALENSKPIQVEKSEVRILSQGLVEAQLTKSAEESLATSKNETLRNNRIENASVTSSDSPGEITTDVSETQNLNREDEFFQKNKVADLVISNEKFQSFTKAAAKDYLVLDARENLEYENGYLPGSLHVRFADLVAGRWIELPKDKMVVVICWSGIRGKEVTEFLRTKKILAVYLEKGASGWVEFGGAWTGNIQFAQKYSEKRYSLVFGVDEVKKKVAAGAVLVDCREPYKSQQKPLPGAFVLPIMYTPTIDLEEAFGRIPAGAPVITVCDGYVNCFDAKVTGVELEKRGHEFLGRFNKPWEWN